MFHALIVGIFIAISSAALASPGKIVFKVTNYAPADAQRASESMLRFDAELSLIMEDESKEVCSGGPYTLTMKYTATPLDREGAIIRNNISDYHMTIEPGHVEIERALYEQGKPLQYPVATSGEISVRLNSNPGDKFRSVYIFEIWNSIDYRAMAAFRMQICVK